MPASRKVESGRRQEWRADSGASQPGGRRRSRARGERINIGTMNTIRTHRAPTVRRAGAADRVTLRKATSCTSCTSCARIFALGAREAEQFAGPKLYPATRPEGGELRFVKTARPGARIEQAQSGRTGRNVRADANFVRQLGVRSWKFIRDGERRQQEAQDRSIGPGPHRPCTDLPAANCGPGRPDADGADSNWPGAAVPACYSAGQQPRSSSTESTAQTQATF